MDHERKTLFPVSSRSVYFWAIIAWILLIASAVFFFLNKQTSAILSALAILVGVHPSSQGRRLYLSPWVFVSCDTAVSFAVGLLFLVAIL